MTERAPGFAERLLAGLSSAVPELSHAGAPVEDLTEGFRREVRCIMTSAAAAGNVVILGRLGSGVLGPRPDLVRVFIHAPLEWRIANVAASLGCTAALARSEISRIDEARRTFARQLYHMAWGDMRNYDLTVDSGRFGIDGAAAVIGAAVHAAAS